MSPRVLVLIALVAVLDLSQCRTVVVQESDVKPADPEGVPKVHVGADGVSASFGGYSASAGLGGQIGGSPGASGGLYARVGTPDDTGASAGLGGSLNPGGQAEGGLYAGAGGSSSTSPSHHGNGNKIRPGSTLYNDIFNIPTSILGAVNRLLNGGVNAAANIGSSQGHAVAAGGEVGATKPAGTGTRTSQGLLNDIFNIPITALNAVNQLLNNNPKNGK